MVDGALKVWKAFSDHKDEDGNRILKLMRKSGGEVTYPIPLQQASRHSMASQIMADHKKKAIEEIQQKLGHSNRQTQKDYILE